MTTADLHDYETSALKAIDYANITRSSVRRRIRSRVAALGALDRYHGMIEAMGRRYSPELWNAVNPLDKRRCQP